MQVRNPPSLRNPGQMSTEVQNGGISGPQEELMSSKEFQKKIVFPWKMDKNGRICLHRGGARPKRASWIRHSFLLNDRTFTGVLFLSGESEPIPGENNFQKNLFKIFD